MATLNQSTCFFTVSARKIFFLNQEEYKINWNAQNKHYSPQKHFGICVCEAKKSRGRRKVKSNVELCNDIREFVSAAGLPEGYVPSMKELSNHGRNDLAHLVRRRGYKLIRDLFSNNIEAETDGSNLEKSLAEGQGSNSDLVDVPADGSTEEHEGVNQSKNEAEFRSKTSSEENFEHAISRRNVVLALNGSISIPKHIQPPGRLNHSVRNDGLPAEDLASSNHKDSDVETSKRENQVDHLKFMLHQKELELSRLKEQIEKEKLALSDLQKKAETEISRAQNIISEKDAELLAAEESLSGLVEVKIQYSGEGQIVEVAGSFNGWHERIRMDPHPSSGVADTGSRKSKLWSTMLWLYPGKYEIKFIVDGHWTIDPERESISRGGISNNILRVVG